MPTFSSRWRPWPWDARVWTSPPDSAPPSVTSMPSTGLMLLPQQSGLLVGKKQTIIETIYPVAQEYESAPVYKERAFMFRPTAGMGERQQSSASDRRYHYALDCWVIGGLFGKGPLLHPTAPPTTGSIRQFIDGLNSARALTLFVLAGANVLQRNDDTNAGQGVAYSRAGHIAQSAVRFESLGTTPIDAVYVAWEDGVLTQLGATAVTCTLPTGMLANFVEKIGRELWIADATHSVVRNATNDPTAAGSWSGPIQVGDSSVPITCLRSAGGKLWILKANGDVFSVNADGSDNDWFPSIGVQSDPNNGLTAASWLGALWFRAGPTFYRMDATATPTLTPIGPERNLQNASEVQGPVQCFTGWGAHLAFCGIYNPTTTPSTGQPTSYLLTYGNWEPAVQTQPTGPSLQFVDQYDGAVAHWQNRQITAMYVTGATPNPRLYCGFTDGGYDWIKLVPNPLTPGSGAEFTLGPSRMVPPLYTAMFQANRKEFVAVSGFGPLVNAGDNAQVSYRLKGSTGAPGPMGDTTWHAVSPAITVNGQRVNFPGNVAGIAAEFAIDLTNATNAETPIFEGLGFFSRVVPDFRYDWTLTVDARDYVARKDGASVRQSGRIIRDLLAQVSAQPSLATVELPDETIEGLAFVQYQERVLPHSGQGARFGQQFAIDLQ
ncbi:MAG TPA: hypothetical protein VFB50_12900, partial [Chloroflexota bacterium]|nr:hypothetical protein [Chloroflexota bacterium]